MSLCRYRPGTALPVLVALPEVHPAQLARVLLHAGNSLDERGDFFHCCEVLRRADRGSRRLLFIQFEPDSSFGPAGP